MPTELKASPRFRAEADMLRPLADAAPLFLRHASVFFEIPCAAGIPDIAIIKLDVNAINDRHGTEPLAEAADVRTMVSLSETRAAMKKSWTVPEAAAHAGVGVGHFRRTILPRLIAGGHLLEDRGQVSLKYKYRSLAKQVVTVEAKRRDWRAAVGQAARHTAVADASWIALDSASSATALKHLHWFTTYGVGLASLSTDGKLSKLVAPQRTHPHRADRELLVERAFSLRRDGRHSGEIPRVFGTRLLATTGVDPRLRDASGY